MRLSPHFVQDGIAGGVAGGQILWSNDGAQSWVRMGGLTDESAANLLEFSPDFASDGQITVGAQDGMLHLSQDGGDTVAIDLGRDSTAAKSWRWPIRRSSAGTRAMVAAVGDAQRLVVIRSSDAGETWMPWVEYDTSLGWASLAILPTFTPDVGPVLLAARDRIAMPPAFRPRSVVGTSGRGGRSSDSAGHGFARFRTGRPGCRGHQ